MEICVFCSTEDDKTKTYMRCTSCKTPCCYACCLFSFLQGEPICPLCYDNAQIKPLIFNVERKTVKKLEGEE